MTAFVTKLWLPALCIICGIFIAKFAELSLSSPSSRSTQSTTTTIVRSFNASSDVPTSSNLRENAAFLVLSRNSDVYGLARTIRNVEDRFNGKRRYDWVFLNDVPFDEKFINITSSLVSGHAHYGQVPKQHWSYPPWIDQAKAAENRKANTGKYLYGDSESYRHMCRFFSGFFFQHELLRPYDYYWRVEPDIELTCDVDFDPFQYMRVNKKKISFTVTLSEIPETIPSLWKTVKEFFRSHPEYLAKYNSRRFLTDDGGRTYNGCHFWSNFEIGSLDWLRSQQYEEFFNHLDQAGGFFYERWGDAPVHTLAATLMLNASDIHFFQEIGYSHPPYAHCPNEASSRKQGKCYCNPGTSVDWMSVSCLSNWYNINRLKFPEDYEEQVRAIRPEDERLHGIEAAQTGFLNHQIGIEDLKEEMRETRLGAIKDLSDTHLDTVRSDVLLTKLGSVRHNDL